LFRRTRRVNLGTYKAPPEVAPAPVEQVAEEGVLIAASAVRMAVKNHLIVRALQQRSAFDRDALADAAASEFVAMAIQNEDSARRVWKDGGWDQDPDDVEEYQRRRDLFLALAAAMRTAADNREMIDQIIDQARDDALAEIGDALVIQPAITDLVPDADYERERKARIRAFKEIDLATLGELAIYRDLLE
jgi:hypothetical protein